MPRTPGSPTTEDLSELMTPGEPYWAAELADHFDVSRRTVQRRLNDMAESGEIRKKKHGDRRAVYWRPG